jgi:hypothetical protein
VTGTADAGGPGRDWRPLAAGDPLHADDLIRTGPGARVELEAGGASRLTVDERTQLSVRELTPAVHRYRLARGLVRVDYERDGDRVVRIEDASGGAMAEARSARFHVAANGLAFAVATQTGTVSLGAAGTSVAVGPGEQALSASGGAPSAPRPVPTDLLLRIAAASRGGTAARCLDTTGRTDPGSLVTVDGQPVDVAADGSFPIRVARRAAPGGVEIRAVAPDGRGTARTIPCQAAPDAPIRDLRVRWKHGGP